MGGVAGEQERKRVGRELGSERIRKAEALWFEGSSDEGKVLVVAC